MFDDPSHATYVDGRFVDVTAPDGIVHSKNPADLDAPAQPWPWSIARIDDAVAAARRAQPRWESLALDDRIALLRRFGAALAARGDAIADAITAEMGKVLRESRAEVKALGTKIDIAIDEGLAYTRPFTLEEGRLACRYRAHGVMAVIGPFNFPLHLAHGHIVPALLAGNTVVFKPSELTSRCAALYAAAAHDATLPQGVLNVVPGDGRAGAHLAAHVDVNGVLFTGSYAVGSQLIRDHAARPGKLLALELGGRNAAIVLDDAPFEKALTDILLSAFSTSGQRCTCTSRLIVARSIADSFVEALAERAAAVRAGHPRDASVFMGPLASEAALSRFEALEREAEQEGTVCVRAPIVPRVRYEDRDLRGCYVAPRVRRVTQHNAASRYQRDEVFGPAISVWVADDDDHALTLANDNDYGLAAGVWTATPARFEALVRKLRAGSVSWNAPTVGASSRLPFGGVGNSGNHRPAGVCSSLYCAWPQAVTRGTVTLDTHTLPPGLT
jgi:succinylglutamic semialdehyde dehydrogenase